MINNKSPEPKRIGIFLGVERLTGGMFQYALSVLEALTRLDARKYSVVIAYSDKGWSPVLSRLGLSGYALRYAKLGQRIADLAMGLQFPQFANVFWGKHFNPLVSQLTALNCDVWVFPAGETISYQMPGKTVGVIHDLMHRYECSFPEVSKLFRYKLREHRMGNIAKYCNAVLVDSNVGRRHVVESYGIPDCKVFSIPYIAPSYLKEGIERPDFDTHYRLPSKFIFYPAQFWPHKNHLRLLQAMHLLIASGTCQDVQLVLSGAKRYKYQQVRDCAQRLDVLDRVHFVGYVPDTDLRGFYVRARALVMPSFFGPTNIPPLEALATGCPAVVSDIYGMREQSGDAAMYFDPKSVDEISDCISTVWNDDGIVAEMRTKGLQQTSSYGLNDFSIRLEAAINNVLDDELLGLQKCKKIY